MSIDPVNSRRQNNVEILPPSAPLRQREDRPEIADWIANQHDSGGWLESAFNFLRGLWHSLLRWIGREEELPEESIDLPPELPNARIPEPPKERAPQKPDQFDQQEISAAIGLFARRGASNCPCPFYGSGGAPFFRSKQTSACHTKIF